MGPFLLNLVKLVVAEGRILPIHVQEGIDFVRKGFFSGLIGRTGREPLPRWVKYASLFAFVPIRDTGTTSNDNNLLFPLPASFPNLSAENVGVILSRLPLFQIFSPISLHPSPLFFESKRGYFIGIPSEKATLKQKPKLLIARASFRGSTTLWHFGLRPPFRLLGGQLQFRVVSPESHG